MSEATKDQIGVEFDKVKEDVLASLGEVKRLAIKEAWKVMQVVIGELVMLIEKIGTDLSSTEKKELAMNLLSGFYDSVFKAVDLPFIPNVFEPLFHEHIGKNVRYDNYTVHPYAVSNKEGSAVMRVGQHHSAGSNIVTEKKGGQTYLEVHLVTIDSYDFKNVGFIKIDVEDHEYQTLQGAQKTIKRYAPTIMIELKNDNTYYNDIMKFMNDLNYNNERIGELDYVFFR